MDQPGEPQVNNILGIANPDGVKRIQTFSGEGSSQTVVLLEAAGICILSWNFPFSNLAEMCYMALSVY